MTVAARNANFATQNFAKEKTMTNKLNSHASGGAIKSIKSAKATIGTGRPHILERRSARAERRAVRFI